MSLTKKELIERIEKLQNELTFLSVQNAKIAQTVTDRDAAFRMGASIAYDAARCHVHMLLYERDLD